MKMLVLINPYPTIEVKGNSRADGQTTNYANSNLILWFKMPDYRTGSMQDQTIHSHPVEHCIKKVHEKH